jgi:hypothetical protein
MINQQIVDAPKEKLAKSGIVQMRVNVVDWGRKNDFLNSGGQLSASFFQNRRTHDCVQASYQHSRLKVQK